MSYMDKHLNYLNTEGTSIKDQQFNNAAKFIESTFADSPFYRVAKWNNTNLEVRIVDINSITRGNGVLPVQFGIKFMQLKPNMYLDIGEVVQIDAKYWMVTDFTSENNLFPKAKIEICNFTLQVKTGEVKTLLGYDDFKAPVYDIQPSYTSMQAILKNTIASVGLNSEINLPSEKMLISITYNDISNSIKENDTFDLYGKDYKVIGISFSNVYYGKGVITLTSERVVNQA